MTAKGTRSDVPDLQVLHDTPSPAGDDEHGQRPAEDGERPAEDSGAGVDVRVDEPPVQQRRSAQPRVWRGIPQAERVQERRARFLEAGLEVFGTTGARHATVIAVCQSAGLTQRYFYESFPNLRTLLAEVFQHVSTLQLEQMADAALGARARGGDLHDAARDALTVYFTGLQADPRVARVQLLEILGGDGSTDRCYQSAIRRAADLVLVVTEMRGVPRPAVPRLLALGLIGAVVEIATMWLLADFSDPLEAVVGSSLVIFDAVIRAELAAGAPPAVALAVPDPRADRSRP